MQFRENELLQAAKQSLTDLREYISDIGGCDHSVGICCCALIDNTERLAVALHGYADIADFDAPTLEYMQAVIASRERD